MHRRTLLLLSICLCAARLSLYAQELKLFDRTIQFHGFASQGFVYTNDNNWLTMKTSAGSGAFTDFGANVSMQVTDRLHVGAQVYDRNLGNLGQWHPSLDWAYADYRFKSWFGIRGGKVKTVIGLYNDTQDLDFLHTFVLLPQSVYPTDLRDTTIAHLGGDLYGKISLRRHLGDLSYTAYAGHRSDSIYSGYPYLLSQHQAYFDTYGGLQYGGDLRWNTPVSGLLVGASRMNEDITGKGSAINPFNPGAGLLPYSESSKADWTNQFYGEYTVGKLDRRRVSPLLTRPIHLQRHFREHHRCTRLVCFGDIPVDETARAGRLLLSLLDNQRVQGRSHRGGSGPNRHQPAGQSHLRRGDLGAY
jgi:hypothetical protein